MMEGTVKWFNFQKGYGFITPQGEEKDVFVHKTSLEKTGIRTLTDGQKVTFEIAINKGKSSAVNIKLA
ncbi:MAG: cold-shock protein [SAR116 cluster bacterium]|nr:cold-shock protein [SAR116 cluster bacterium]RPH08501.1 MAG: cold-shock protein [Alphaproteobacteria bacterium TMED54]